MNNSLLDFVVIFWIKFQFCSQKEYTNFIFLHKPHVGVPFGTGRLNSLVRVQLDTMEYIVSRGVRCVCHIVCIGVTLWQHCIPSVEKLSTLESGDLTIFGGISALKQAQKCGFGQIDRQQLQSSSPILPTLPHAVKHDRS